MAYPGKWKHGLLRSISWWLNFDSYPDLPGHMHRAGNLRETKFHSAQDREKGVAFPMPTVHGGLFIYLCVYSIFYYYLCFSKFVPLILVVFWWTPKGPLPVLFPGRGGIRPLETLSGSVRSRSSVLHGAATSHRGSQLGPRLGASGGA